MGDARGEARGLGAGREGSERGTSVATSSRGSERGETGGEGAAVLRNLDGSSPFMLRVKFAKFGGFWFEAWVGVSVGEPRVMGGVLAGEPCILVGVLLGVPYCNSGLVDCPPKEPGG